MREKDGKIWLRKNRERKEPFSFNKVEDIFIVYGRKLVNKSNFVNYFVAIFKACELFLSDLEQSGIMF